MVKVAPSILSADFSVPGDEIKKVDVAGADWIHIDVMDGHFVPNLTFGAPVVKCVRKVTDLTFDVHLMIENPGKYVEDFKKAGADIITIHQEACPDLVGVIKLIKSLGVKVGVSINPATPVDTVKNVLADIDLVLVMSVNPGFGGQSYIHSVTPKIKELKEIREKENLSFVIEVDGGIDDKTAPEAVGAGADVLVAGSYIYKSEDVAEKIRIIKNA